MATFPPSPTLAGNGMTARRHASRVIALIALLLMVPVLVSGCGGSDAADGPEQPTFSFVIPDGSGERIENGEPLDILPRELQTEIGETIQIVNLDDQAHFLGPWFVGPGETLRQRFLTEGVFEGSCTVHPSGEFTVVVEPADAA